MSRLCRITELRRCHKIYLFKLFKPFKMFKSLRTSGHDLNVLNGFVKYSGDLWRFHPAKK